MNIYDINFNYLSLDDKNLFFQLGLHKNPYIGIYRKNWDYFLSHLNHQKALLNSRNYTFPNTCKPF